MLNRMLLTFARCRRIQFLLPLSSTASIAPAIALHDTIFSCRCYTSSSSCSDSSKSVQQRTKFPPSVNGRIHPQRPVVVWNEFRKQLQQKQLTNPSPLLLYKPSWLSRNNQSCISQYNFSSTSTPAAATLVETSVNGGVGTIRMSNGIANSLSYEMCTALSTAIKELEANDAVRAIVLTSSNTKIFCAGLDIHELILQSSESESSNQKLIRFWKSFQKLYVTLDTTKLVTIANINGHAIAGGCILAMCCDYRIMSNAHNTTTTIGLSEVLLGMKIQSWILQLLIDTIGIRRAELAVSRGTLFTPTQAYEIGLIDEITTDTSTAAADQIATDWVTQTSICMARSINKQTIRSMRMNKFNADEDLEDFVKYVQQSTVQTNLKQYLNSLKKKKK